MSDLKLDNLPFSVLIVDDRPEDPCYRELMGFRRESKSPTGKMVVDFARSAADAKLNYLTKFYYHAVYCDYFLGSTTQPYSESSEVFGTHLLAWVRDNRPSARRILHTSKLEYIVRDRSGGPPQEYVLPFLRAISPSLKQWVEPAAHYCLERGSQPDLPLDIARLMEAEDVRNSLKSVEVVVRDPEDPREVAWAHEIVDLQIGDSTRGELMETLRQLFRTFRIQVPRSERSTNVFYDGPAADPNDADIRAIDRLIVSQLAADGRSGARVLQCTPCFGKHEGTVCVVKLDSVSGIQREVQGFDSFVKFHRSSDRRVEMLSHVQLNAIGGVCYTFAGGANKKAVPLKNLLEQRDVRAITCIHSNYSPLTKDWYAGVEYAGADYDRQRQLSGFFQREHFDRVKKKHPEAPDEYLKIFQERLDAKIKIITDAIGAAGTVEIPLLAGTDSANHSAMTFDNCVIHGDMNAGNMFVVPAQQRQEWNPHWDDPAYDKWLDSYREYLHQQSESAIEAQQHGAAPEPRRTALPRLAVGDGDKSIVIDYQFTKRGPIFVDFAALEIAVRLFRGTIGNRHEMVATKDVIEAWVDTESRVWNEAWDDETYDHLLLSSARGDADGRKGRYHKFDYWGAVSYELKKLARRNFEEAYAASGRPARMRRDWEEQYAATCLFYVARQLLMSGFTKSVDEAIKRLSEPGSKRLDDQEEGALGLLRLSIWAQQLRNVLRAPRARAPEPTSEW